MRQADVAVIGAGPAGLAAALSAADAGGRVVLLDGGEAPGRKLAASGGGRGNLANARPNAGLAAAFGRHGRFALPALERLDLAALRGLLERLGVPTHLPDGMHLYPASERAADVRDAFVAALRRAPVEIRLGPAHAVTALSAEAAPDAPSTTGAPAWIRLSSGAGPLAARAVVLAAGGPARPDLGGTRAGLDIAREMGHAVREPVPALVPLRVAEAWPRGLAGLSVPEVTLRPEGKGRAVPEVRGAVLFTHRGLSGPAALDLSAAVAERLAVSAPVRLRVGFLPGETPESSAGMLRAWRAEAGGRTVRAMLRTVLPNRLADALAQEAGVGETRLAELSAAAERALADSLADCVLTVTGTEGFRAAMAMRGGVRLKEVRPETLESRRAPGLFFAGEILDLDGPCGGYHLHWAFASGGLAGEAAAGRACAGPA